MAIITLRHLLSFDLVESDIIYYEKELNKLLLVGLHNYEYDNSEAI